MDSEHGKKRRIDDNNIERAVAADRLSGLPDDLIHKIFSFISIKDTVKTMLVLSSRYRSVWTTMPYLIFSVEDFKSLLKFSKFVTQFLKRRNKRICVSFLKFSFRGKVTQPFVKKIMNYASAHNIQRLEVTYLLENNIKIPLSLFRCTSLKHLSLEGKKYSSYRSLSGIKILRATSTLELPALTTLCLRNATFYSDGYTDNCVGLLSKCPNLKNLTLESCETEGLSNFSISHPGLSDLTLDAGLNNVKVVKVVAPQLENLIIRCRHTIREHVISAPALTSLDYEGYHPLHLSTDRGFPSLKEVNICYSDPFVARNTDTRKCEDAHEIVQHLRGVEFLKLNLEFIELLFSSEELISRQPSPFVNLKNLTIYPLHLYERGLPKPTKVNLFTEVKNYVLDSSPGATLKMTSREDIIAVKEAPSNQASAQKLMAELRVLLEQAKANNTKTKGKAPMESNNEKMYMDNLELIKSCWNNVSEQFGERKVKACRIISKLESIEGLLKKLPATNRAMIEPCYSSLCTEAVIVMSKITDGIKIGCDENRSRLTASLLINLLMEPSS